MRSFRDQTGFNISLRDRPLRVVSLVPSQSQFLWDIGVRDELKGITKFCIHPDEMFQSVTRVGGTKELNIDRIRAIKPDLIIGNKEENTREQIELLRSEFTVWVSDVNTFEDAFSMMETLGGMTGKEAAAREIIRRSKSSVARCMNLFSGSSVAYFIWSRPYMFAGKNTFIDHVLTHVGLKNALGSMDRYPVVEIEDLHNARPDFCFLSTEPFPFKETHAALIREQLPESKVFIVDGEIFSWYGSSLMRLADYMTALRKKII